jgi:hypothetical protein
VVELDGPTVEIARVEIGKEEKLQVVVLNAVVLVLEGEEGYEEDQEGGVLDSHRDLGAKLPEPKQYERDVLASAMSTNFCSLVLVALLNFVSLPPLFGHVWVRPIKRSQTFSLTTSSTPWSILKSRKTQEVSWGSHLKSATRLFSGGGLESLVRLGTDSNLFKVTVFAN